MAQQDAQNGAAEKKSPVAFSAVKPQLVVAAPKASDAIEFYKSVFGAEEVGRTLHPKRKAEQEQPLVLSAQLSLAGTTILVSDNTDDCSDAVKNAGSGCFLCLETEDVEAAVSSAVKAGAVAEGEICEPEGGACCGGGRVGKIKDPYGFTWLICNPAKKPAAEVEA